MTGSPNGNGMAGAIRSGVIIVSILSVQGGLVAATYTVLDQRIDSNAAIRQQQLDQIRGDLAELEARVHDGGETLAAYRVNLQEIETQFRMTNGIREGEDARLRDALQAEHQYAESERSRLWDAVRGHQR